MSENHPLEEEIDKKEIDKKEIGSEPDRYAEAMQALYGGIQELPIPKASRDLQSRVLQTLTSGRDFDPWPRQTGRRLRWMLLPALIAAAFTSLWLHHDTRALFSDEQLPSVEELTPPALVPLSLTIEDSKSATRVTPLAASSKHNQPIHIIFPQTNHFPPGGKKGIR